MQLPGHLHIINFRTRAIKYSIVNYVMSSFKTDMFPNVTISLCGGRVTAARAKSREELTYFKQKSTMKIL